MAQYVVTAPLVLLDPKDAEGRARELYHGTTVPDTVSTEWLDRHLEMGMIGEPDAAAAPKKAPAKKAAAPKKAPAEGDPPATPAPAGDASSTGAGDSASTS